MYILFSFPPLWIAIALLAYVFQLRAADQRRTPGGASVRALRGTGHALSLVALGVSCPHAFEIAMALRPRVLGLTCGALGAIACFMLALTLADKAIDTALALVLADSRGLELLPLRDVARLEVPDAVVFSLIMVGWAVLEASSH